MLRSPSGVTAIKHMAVEGPLVAGLVEYCTPSPVMLARKAAPSRSSFTLPSKMPRAPSEASPAIVFAADPPAISRGLPSAV